ncbi:MAG: hypothetical protein CL902_06540 [Dehalococcoidia bacterium]|nr:hypothetical protein [Dehalococcoidia bacterium]
MDSRNSTGNLLGILALCGIAGPIIFAVLVTIGGFIYDDYSHASQAVSELGGVDAEHAWLQRVNFFIIGFAFIALAIGLHRGINDENRSIKAPALIFIFGVSAGIANGIFPCDSGCDGSDFNGFMHNLTGLFGFACAIVSVFVISRRLKGDPDWNSVFTYSRVFRFLVLGGVLSWFIISKVIGNEDVNGVFQRVFIGVWLVWAEIMALRLFALSRE